jgi:hypothetical protein
MQPDRFRYPITKREREGDAAVRAAALASVLGGGDFWAALRDALDQSRANGV